MKKTLLRSIYGAIVATLIFVGNVHASEVAQPANSQQNKIVGVWDVQVAVLDCNTGGQLAGFSGLHKYELGGTAQVVPSTNPAAMSAHVGIWRHVRKNQYRLEFKMFRFDPSGITSDGRL